VSSTVKPGRELNAALDGTVALASLAGTSLDDMSQALQGAATSGDLTGKELYMLQTRGVNALSILADAYGVTQSEAERMVKEGKISFNDFMDAVNKTTDGAAKIMGTSIRSMWENLNAALGRAGEKIVGPLLEGFRTVAPALTSVIDSIGVEVGTMMEGVAARIQPVFEDIADWLDNLASGGGFSDLIGMFEKVKGAAIVLGTAGIGPLLRQIPLIGGLFRGLTGPIGLVIGLFIEMWTESEILRNAVSDAFQRIGEAVQGSGGAFESLSDLVSTVAKALGDTLGTALNIVVPIVETLAKAFNATPEGLQKAAIIGGGAGLAFFKLGGTLSGLRSGFETMQIAALYGVDAIKAIPGALASLPGHAAAAAGAVGRLSQAMMTLTRTAITGMIGGLKKAALAMKGLAVSMLTNPVGIAIAAFV